MVEVTWTNQALSDLNDIGEYITKDSQTYASIFINRLYRKPEQLQDNPKLGRLVPELNNPKIRELIEGSYRIIYKITNNKRIDVLTVHHSARLLINNPKIPED